MKFPTMDEFAQMVADKAIDEIEYNGKTLREWVEIISAIPVTAIPATDINVGTELGTNLAEVGKDCISRQAAINALGELATFTEDWSCHTWMYTDDVYNAIKQLPPIQPKRGKWNRLGRDVFNCNKCGATFVLNQGGEKMRFCPNCGADMREVTT